MELRVENFAIIEKLSVSFEKGLTVITGETGAGKSMLIDAITLLVGGRGSSGYVRHGESKAEIEALFEVASGHPCQEILKGMGIDDTDGHIILRRQIYSNGKSVCRINDMMVTLSHLREVGQHLIDIHGQHEHQGLLHPETHIQLLDKFGGQELRELKIDYERSFIKAREITDKIQKFSETERQIAQRLDLLHYQIQEIEVTDLQIEEEEMLFEERRKLNNFAKIYDAVAVSYEALSGEDKGLDWIRSSVNALENVQEFEEELGAIVKLVASSFYTLEDQVYRLRDYLDQLTYDPQRLDVVEARLDEINHLKRKYGKTVADVLTYYQEIKQEHEALIDRDQTIEGLDQQLKELFLHLHQKATKLSVLRKRVAGQLIKAINRELKDLHMEKAYFDVSINHMIKGPEDIQSYHKQGADQVEFYIATNPGEPPQPLAHIASGGEMSRIMLALKSHFKAFQGVTSIIFDEVDTGVSGRVAQAMAEKIFQLSVSSQIFCITHLPQVAAMADQHLYIAKKIKGDRTLTSVRVLTESDKISEIARMISGVEMTDLTKQHAHELLELAQDVKK